MSRYVLVGVAAGLTYGCASFPTMKIAPESNERVEPSEDVAGLMRRNGPSTTVDSKIMQIPGIAPVARPAPPPQATEEQIAALVGEEPINASLPPQPLVQYLNTAFTEVLGVPFALGPDIGTRNTIITVNAPPTISKRAYLGLLQNTLRSYGLTLSIRNNAVLVTDETGGVAGGAQRPQIVRSRSSADTPQGARVVQVFQLVALQATPELVNLAQRIGGFGGQPSLQVDAASNALAIEGQSRQVAAMVDILRNLDQPAYAGAEVARLEPIYQSPAAFAANLGAALAAEGFIVSADPLGPKSIMILPLNSTNQTLVFAADRATMARVQFWAREIDSPTAQGDQADTFVYEVRNTAAGNVGLMLANAGAQAAQNRLTTAITTPGGGGGGGGGAAAALALQQAARAQVANPNAGRGGIGTQQVGGGGFGGAQAGGAAINRGGSTAVSNANRTAAAPLNVTGSSPMGGAFTVDDAGNRILFTGSATQFAQLRGLMQRLDVPAREVLVEVTVAEVTLSDETRAGLEFFFNASYQNGPVSGGTGIFPAPAAPFPGAGAGLAGGGLGLSNTGATLNFSNSSGDLRAAFNAFASNNKVNVLSRPHLTAKSGSQAQIQVGDEVPIITSQRAANTTTGGDTDTLQTVQYRQTGVILTITPVVYGDDRVDLTITQEVSDVRDNPNTAIGSPIIGSRTVSTTLTLADGRSAILGGLMEDRFAKSNRGVPFFKDVPVLGQAFRSDTISGRKTELVVLITPLIIRNSDDMSSLAAQVSADMNKAFDVGRGGSYTLTPYPLGQGIGIYPPSGRVLGGATLQRRPVVTESGQTVAPQTAVAAEAGPAPAETVPAQAPATPAPPPPPPPPPPPAAALPARP